MQIGKNTAMATNTVHYGDMEIATLADQSIQAIARLIAQKYIEQNYGELMKDQEFLATVRDAAAKMTAEKIADHIERLIIPEQAAE